MKINFNNKITRGVLRALLFLGSVALVYECLPHQIRFNHQYQLGKPWTDELLTAEYDFPIYKSESEIKLEQDSILRFWVPYFAADLQIGEQKIANFVAEHANMNTGQRETIVDGLRQIFEGGIAGANELNELQKMGVRRISVIDSSNVAHEMNLNEVHSVRSAYNALIEKCQLTRDALNEANLNHYLVENLTLDTKKSEQAKTELFASISPTAGMVQAGERIVGRGELVDYQVHKILKSLEIISSQKQIPLKNQQLVVLGKILLIVALLLLLFLYIYLFRNRIFHSNRDILFIMLTMVLMVGLASLSTHFAALNIYLVPFALLPILVRTFYDSRTALFTHIITVLITSFMAPQPFEFLILQIIAGMTVVSSLKEVAQRSQLVLTAALVFAAYSITYFAFVLIHDASLDRIDWWMFAYFAINASLQMLAYALIYIFEKSFGFLSNMTLLELSNINNKLLMEFSTKAPGTFQHALQVSNLATAAAASINANTLLARTGALYHDIGKMVNPLCFTENQASGMKNPMDELPPDEAAQTIIAHVANGVRIAEKNKLPKRITAFILTHHATGKATFFYNTYKNAHPDEAFDETPFVYPGPNPGSKETTIVMMADAIEAASRSLKNFDDKSIDDLVERIVGGQIAANLFSLSPISCRDIETVKNVFKEKLKNIYHSRISYPELEKPKRKRTKKS